jgi:hypothetical protein
VDDFAAAGAHRFFLLRRRVRLSPGCGVFSNRDAAVIPDAILCP